jgi:glutathione S-transferase
MTITFYELAGATDALRFSPNTWRTRMALAHKGLVHDTELCRFVEKDKIAFSGQKLVPVLRDDETVVCDSWAIACYLEDTYPDRPSLFGCDVGRATTRFVNVWTNTVLHPALVRLLLTDIHTSLHEMDKAYFRESREKRFGKTLEQVSADKAGNLAAVRAALAPVDATLAQQDWLGGDGPAYADYLIFGGFQWARAVSPAVLAEPGTPLHVWNERMLDLYDGLGRSLPAAES